MKIFRESIIILGIYLLGELISKSLKLPVPGNILGMIILLILLCTKVVKVDQVNTVSNFLLDHLSFFFIPAGVNLMTSFGVIKDTWFKLILICILTTIVFIVSTGKIVQYISKHTKNKERN